MILMLQCLHLVLNNTIVQRTQISFIKIWKNGNHIHKTFLQYESPKTWSKFSGFPIISRLQGNQFYSERYFSCYYKQSMSVSKVNNFASSTQCWFYAEDSNEINNMKSENCWSWWVNLLSAPELLIMVDEKIFPI